MKRLHYWVRDYLHASKKLAASFLYRYPPSDYEEGSSNPVILIPGIFEKWHFLQEIGDSLSEKGHPVYVIEDLRYNTSDIPRSARRVRDFINKKGLQGIVIIAHSKGGLIGKYLLKFYNRDNKIKKLIAIATPWAGSSLAKFVPVKAIKELSPKSKFILELQEDKKVNSKITSIFGTFDNHIWPQASGYLEGGENIQVDVYGYHRLLGDKKVIEIIAGATTLKQRSSF